MVAREHGLVQRQAEQASAAAEEESRLVKQAQALDAQRAELQAQDAQAVKASSLLNPGVLACATTPDAVSCKPLPDKNLFLTSILKLLCLNNNGTAYCARLSQVQALTCTLCSPSCRPTSSLVRALEQNSAPILQRSIFAPRQCCSETKSKNACADRL